MNKEQFKTSLVIYEPRDGSKSYETPLRCRLGFHKGMGLDQCVLCEAVLKDEGQEK